MSRVLEGVRVLDFGRYVAGPFAGTILGDFGADVIRVERRGGSEDRVIQPVTPEGEGAIFLQINRNKRSITLDPKGPRYGEILRRLVAEADVVLANVPAQALKSMGIDYESLRAIKPDIILANVSSFGPVGPWADRGGFDSVGQAMSGAAYLTGEADQPYRMPISWVDHSTALYTAIGVLLALIERRASGQGQEVGATLLGSALSFSSGYLIEQAVRQLNRVAIGNRSFINGPTDMFTTKDGWIVVQTVGNPLFKRWVKLMGEPEWLEDPRFATDISRADNGEALSERMGRWCQERTTDQALDELAAAGIPAGPVLSPQAALDHPQVQAMGVFQEVAYPGLDAPAPLLNLPVSLSRTPGEIRSSPPTVGEHNAEVLGALGFTDAEIAAFAEDGTI